jgi:hypothetical protein
LPSPPGREPKCSRCRSRCRDAPSRRGRSRPGECFSGERLAIPERAVSEPLHLLRELALGGCWLAIQRSGEHAYAAGIDAVKSREAHGGSDSTRPPAPDDPGTTLGEDLGHRGRNDGAPLTAAGVPVEEGCGQGIHARREVGREGDCQSSWRPGRLRHPRSLAGQVREAGRGDGLAVALVALRGGVEGDFRGGVRQFCLDHRSCFGIDDVAARTRRDSPKREDSRARACLAAIAALVNRSRDRSADRAACVGPQARSSPPKQPNRNTLVNSTGSKVLRAFSSVEAVFVTQLEAEGESALGVGAKGPLRPDLPPSCHHS